ncbi:MAG: threonine--tRNA ligase [Candidatus Bathyarchaeota archaeon]|nr:MAG: threonine--tRNA ligase [Candidatus Bathyarchaeota archaeon]
MRILQLHSNFIEYEPVKKEASIAEECEKGKHRLEEVVVLFTCIEQGDNEGVARRAMEEVKTSLQILKVNRILIYPYAHLSKNLANPRTALEAVIAMEKIGKEMGIEVSRTPFGWCKQFSISIKGHPLAEQGKIINADDLKEETRKKRWKTPKPEYLVLTTDGRAVPAKDYRFGKSEADFAALVEKEAFKEESCGGEPKYIKALRKFGFEWEACSDSGHMRYGPKASLMVDLAGDYAWQSVNELGIPSFSIKGTNLFNLNVPAIREHADLFGERLYTVRVDNEEFVLKYAACFQQFSMIKDWTISYRQIPLGMFEIADSYRLEQSGECLVGFRLRRFYMPDYHIFCRDLGHAKEVSVGVHQKIFEKIRELGNEYVSVYNLTKSFFEKNRKFLEKLVAIEEKPVLLHFVPEGKYYWVINVEYCVIDELRRPREIATFQIDMGNASRFGIEYVDKDRKKKHPSILHIAILGGIERYIFTVFDTALKQKIPRLPLWLAPIQVRVIPVSDSYAEPAQKLADEIEDQQVRVDVDDRPITMQKKVRDAEMEWINYIVVIGQKEVDSGILPVRDRETGKIRKMSSQDLVDDVKKKLEGKPFRALTLPKLLSQRPQF